jgi:hypothetical protein
MREQDDGDIPVEASCSVHETSMMEVEAIGEYVFGKDQAFIDTINKAKSYLLDCVENALVDRAHAASNAKQNRSISFTTITTRYP